MKKIEELVKGAASAVVTGHVRPDGDCVGACLAVKNYLKRACPALSVTVCLEDFAESFLFLDGASETVTKAAGNFDVCLVLDASSRDRLCEGVLPAFLGAGKTICIDHHITNTGFAEESFVEPSASSTCEVLFSMMDERYLGEEVAQCLYLGIVHDTGVFKHSNTTERTMEIAGRLISLGVRPEKIIDETFYKKTFFQNKILGEALSRACLYLDGRVIASYITKEEMDVYRLSGKDLDGIIDQLRVTEGTEAAVFLYELTPGLYKVSLRANGSADVSRTAGAFGGGGHVKAAGCQIPGNPEEIVGKVLEELKKQL